MNSLSKFLDMTGVACSRDGAREQDEIDNGLWTVAIGCGLQGSKPATDSGNLVIGGKSERIEGTVEGNEGNFVVLGQEPEQS